MQATGLTRESVKNARRSLVDAGVVNGDDSDDRPGYISLVPVIEVTDAGDLIFGGAKRQKRYVGLPNMIFGSRGVGAKYDTCSYPKDSSLFESKENESNAIVADGTESLNLTKKEKQQTKVTSSQAQTAPAPKPKAQPAARPADPVSRVWLAYPERMRRSRGAIGDALIGAVRYLVACGTITIDQDGAPIDVSTERLAMDFISLRINEYAKSPEGQRGHIPEPAKWLKNQRYMDATASWQSYVSSDAVPVSRRVEVEYTREESDLARRRREVREEAEAKKAKAAAAA
ncbi:hypothetical protein RMSM_01170 [Rhodopirellula maiorica SM1]|uniref:Uncharacterized protein n=2 Tax=Novipirellula TaxID=2795426 RepID=M5RRS9_9BACT|nr:hypothetical protein RMSM_01170 [Rhodopirellula maiorica SM1]